MASSAIAKRGILITGATGKQGGATIDALISEGALKEYILLGVTRDATSAGAKGLESRGVRVVQGDFSDCKSLFENAKTALGRDGSKIHGVFSVQASDKNEEVQGKSLIDAAMANNVRHFVYSSVDRGGPLRSPTNPTNVPHFASKHNIERHLMGAKSTATDGMRWTILRPVAFMDNLTPGFGAKLVATGWQLLLGNKPIQLIATRDIGFFAARALLRPDEYAGRSISLAGDELTIKQIGSVFKTTTGTPLPTTMPLAARMIFWLSKDVGSMMKWFASDGYGADINALRAEYPKLQTFSDWMKQSPWVKK